MRFIYLGLLFYCLISYTYTQTFTCNSIPGYDIKTLTNVVQWKTATTYQCIYNRAANCTFYFSFCQSASMCFDEYSACEIATGAPNMTIIGAYSGTLFHRNESDSDGFYALYPPAPYQNISNETSCAPSLRINFRCNKDISWQAPIGYNATGTAPIPTEVEADPHDPCLTIMTIDYAGACYHGSQPPDKDISFGAIFLITLFSAVVVYFVFGALYNGLVKHRSGINLIPQTNFWIGLPLHAIEGCRATLSCCSGTPKPSQATYASV